MNNGLAYARRPQGCSDRRVEIVSGGCPRHAYGQPPRRSWADQGPGAAEKPWGIRDPETERKKRVARYKAYGEGGTRRVKGSLRRGIRWIKDKFSQIVNG
ncbi:hypothetical protein SAY86_002345 [Trapa natans]|uniref:DUF3511 domain protein n=1 Tax=Trapa natans TaxID=22666 RepID=A0AAN7R389_TRANT|nr:hypothetical protein SAY86_002345 [Trapa natans]